MFKTWVLEGGFLIRLKFWMEERFCQNPGFGSEGVVKTRVLAGGACQNLGFGRRGLSLHNCVFDFFVAETRGQ